MLSEEPSSGDSFTTTLNKWAEETGNSVELMVIPYDDQLTKFPLMAKNKDLPDLVSTTRLSRLYPDEFVDLGQVVDTSIFEPMALEIISQEYNSDKLSCLPLQFTITNVFYNKDAFEAAGLEVPTVDDRWTMDEVYEAAAKLMADGGVKYGMAVDFSRARYDNLMYMNGGSWWKRTAIPSRSPSTARPISTPCRPSWTRTTRHYAQGHLGRRLHRQPRRLLQERRRGHVLLRFLELQCIHHGHHRL